MLRRSAFSYLIKNYKSFICTRETAFVTAAWAAGAVQAVTRACSRGRISTCDCDIGRRGGSKAADTGGSFTWGGCSDPIRYGMRLVRLFQEPRLPASKRVIYYPGDLMSPMKEYWKTEAAMIAVLTIIDAITMFFKTLFKSYWQK
ncbi:unnamed protein product [Hymenolepis diminuta]|uniref:Protein Wnt n=1 Tax=Hymenolepis diminuta TaxID=6216 RepID=A0A0R3SK76_HYMDI|nr:unnamed protein product [Hymenolepis diminuta]